MPAPRKKSEFLLPCSIGCGILLVPFIIAISLRSYVLASYYIPSGSMQPTLKPGSTIIAYKYEYLLLHKEPARGDIVVFIYPDASQTRKKVSYVQRCIGLPGDTVEIRDGVTYINGSALSEPYVAEPATADYGPITVPQDSFFMLGDNRNRSSDSRMWGFVPRKNLVAHVTGH